MKIIKLISFLVSVVFTSIALAVPAVPGMIDRTQPDGTQIRFELKGDENMSWGVTPDGYTLLPDKSGFWTLATLDKKGDLISSNIRYKGGEGAPLAKGIQRGLKFSKAQSLKFKKDRMERKQQRVSSLQMPGTFPTTGKHKMLMVLATFNDRQPVMSRVDFDNYMNQQGYNGIGSFRDFYLENSYGQLDITTTVTEWVRLPYNHSHYGYGEYGSGGAEEIVEYVLNYLHNSGKINISDYDNDKDGLLDGVAIIHQGPGQESTGNTNDIWSHTGYPQNITVAGVRVGSYTIQPEVFGNTGRQSTIGVMCHEFGHNLGAPDFYDTNYEQEGQYGGTGPWDLMCSGSWNGNYGDRPANINMWQKIQYGWVEPTVLSEDVRVEALPDAAFNPRCYIMPTTEEGDYFVIENRQNVSVFDKGLPGRGILIYHANEKGISDRLWTNTVNASYPQCMYLVSASAGMNPSSGDPLSYGDDLPAYPYGEVNSFADETLPSAISVNGYMAYSGLYNIAANADGTMSFDFRIGDAPAAPTALEAVANGTKVSLSWEYDNDGDVVDYYTIERNDKKIANVTETTYIDSNAVADQKYTYHVRAVLKSGKRSPLATAYILVPINNIRQIHTDFDKNDGLRLYWDLNNEFSYLRSDIVPLQLGIGTSIVEYAHRYRAENVALYDGYEVDGLEFIPCEANMGMASYTLRVWEAEPDGTPSIVAEKKVEGVTADANTLVKFDQKPTIHAGKELWFSVLTETTGETIYFYVNSLNLTPGFGNLMRGGEEAWTADGQTYGDFIITSKLTAPAQNHTVTIPCIDDNENFDAKTDLMCPIGFAIYRDGEYLGSTSSRCYLDANYDGMPHTYGVASLYRNGNISKMRELSVAGIGGIGKVAADSLRGKIRVKGGVIEIADWQEDVQITHISGLQIYNTSQYSGQAICVTPGVYLVKTGKYVEKVIVK